MSRQGRTGYALVIGIVLIIGLIASDIAQQNTHDSNTQNLPQLTVSAASDALKALPIKGRAPKTGYSRTQFGNGWNNTGTCDERDRILARDMTEVMFAGMTCEVASGTLHDPYTDKVIYFVRGPDTSDDVQIDHVVALSDAWQKGAQQLTPQQRHVLANDPLELLAVDGPTNQAKGDGDAATWLPPNKSYRCNYVARQVAVKVKYSLWVTRSEYDAMARILNTCPHQLLPTD